MCWWPTSTWTRNLFSGVAAFQPTAVTVQCLEAVLFEENTSLHWSWGQHMNTYTIVTKLAPVTTNVILCPCSNLMHAFCQTLTYSCPWTIFSDKTHWLQQLLMPWHISADTVRHHAELATTSWCCFVLEAAVCRFHKKCCVLSINSHCQLLLSLSNCLVAEIVVNGNS